jgi:hypothetical protein
LPLLLKTFYAETSEYAKVEMRKRWEGEEKSHFHKARVGHPKRSKEGEL